MAFDRRRHCDERLIVALSCAGAETLRFLIEVCAKLFEVGSGNADPLPQKTDLGFSSLSRRLSRVKSSIKADFGYPLAKLIEVKSLGGTNFVRPDRVIAVQTSPTGSTVIVMEGGAVVNSSETTLAVAARLRAAEDDS
ncbi:hypothetical protein [Chenggangzhangella methanolivorans]|uniref:hypothetical protein n=1 Tax=Chenggangzhangella methanolivorans TaxID=1437009 RepID=UPI0021BD69FB|nr:hypothetical protein [Chenggangzhangella methanolivorans]